MAGRYGEILAGEGYLGHYQVLDASRAAASEADADLFIDRKFDAWDRQHWSQSTAPQGICEAWDQRASGKYIQRDVLRGNPTASEELMNSAGLLIGEAESTADEMRSRGYLVGRNGKRIWPKGGQRGASTFSVAMER